jgi:hypothetical protein
MGEFPPRYPLLRAGDSLQYHATDVHERVGRDRTLSQCIGFEQRLLLSDSQAFVTVTQSALMRGLPQFSF